MDDCRRCNEDSLMPETYVCADCQISLLKIHVTELEKENIALRGIIANLLGENP